MNSLTTYVVSSPLFSPGQAYNTKARLADIGDMRLDLNFLFVMAAMLVAKRGLPSLKSSRAVRVRTTVLEWPKLNCPLVDLE